MRKQIIIDIEDNVEEPFESRDVEHIKNQFEQLLREDYDVTVKNVTIKPDLRSR